MFAAGMVPVNDGLVVVVGLACFDVLVDGGIGDPHVLLIGLALVKAGRGRFGDNGLGRLQISKKFKDLRRRQVGDGIEVIGPIPPLGEVAHVVFTGVAGARHQAVLTGGHGIEGEHPQPGGQVAHSGVGEGGDGPQSLHGQFLLGG